MPLIKMLDGLRVRADLLVGTESRMSRRDNTARIDVEVWQLPARLGRNPETELPAW
jgi:hypothetical protein